MKRLSWKKRVMHIVLCFLVLSTFMPQQMPEKAFAETYGGSYQFQLAIGGQQEVTIHCDVSAIMFSYDDNGNSTSNVGINISDQTVTGVSVPMYTFNNGGMDLKLKVFGKSQGSATIIVYNTETGLVYGLIGVQVLQPSESSIQHCVDAPITLVVPYVSNTQMAPSISLSNQLDYEVTYSTEIEDYYIAHTPIDVGPRVAHRRLISLKFKEEGTTDLVFYDPEGYKVATYHLTITGHNYVLTGTTEATCIERAVETYQCESCGKTYQTAVGELTDHVWNDKYTVDVWPTCVEKGSQSVHCSVCGVINESTVRSIPVTDHTYPDTWTTTKSATCTEDGIKEKKCTICGNKISETIPATGHNWENEFSVDKAATCTEAGIKSIHCSVCDAVQEGSSHVIPARGHLYGDWATIKEPTCTEEGRRQKICERCGDVENEAINAAGHQWNVECTIDINPTCTEAGLESIHCSVCDAVQEGSGRAIPMTSHTFGAWESVTAATYDAAGLEEHICKDCGLKEQREIPMLPRTDLTAVEISGVNDMTFTGTELIQGPTLKANGIAMVEGTDYEAVYANNVNAGTATMIITGIGAYKGTVTKTFEIMPADVASMSYTTIPSKTYSGSAQKPSFTATYNGIEYLSGTTDQFIASYSSNVKAGTATIKVTGKGNFTGTKVLHFTIKPKAITPTVTLSATTFTYTGKAKSPGVTVKYGTKTLTKDTDYTITKSAGRIYPGKYSVTVKLKGNYSGSKTVYFYVKGDLSKSVTKVSVGSISNKTYTGNAIKPSPTVKAIGPKGKVVTLKKGTDYTLSYSNNKNVGKATITIKGKGKYKGTKKVTFKIVPKGTEVGPWGYGANVGYDVDWDKQTIQTSGYQLQYSTSSSFKAGSTKTINIKSNKTTNCKYTPINTKKREYWRIRTYKTVNGTKYYSKWSEVIWIVPGP